MKTKEEIIKEKYPFYDPDIAQKDIEINAEQAMILMENYAQQSQPSWIPVENPPEETETRKRVLVFSPAYPVGDPMRIRIIDTQFLKISTYATHWQDLIEPEK